MPPEGELADGAPRAAHVDGEGVAPLSPVMKACVVEMADGVCGSKGLRRSKLP